MERILTLRKRINEVNEQILQLLNERAKLCKDVGTIKKEKGIPIRNYSRESEIFRDIKEKASKLGLNPYHVELIYRKIIDMCIDVQESDEKI